MANFEKSADEIESETSYAASEVRVRYYNYINDEPTEPMQKGEYENVNSGDDAAMSEEPCEHPETVVGMHIVMESINNNGERTTSLCPDKMASVDYEIKKPAADIQNDKLLQKVIYSDSDTQIGFSLD